MNRLPALLGVASCAAIAITLVLLLGDLVTRRAFDLVFALAFASTIAAALSRLGFGGRGAAFGAIAVTALAIAAQMAVPAIRLAPYLAVVLINAFVAYVFARGLIGGREPLILQLAKSMRIGPEGSPGFQSFAYRQCWIWATFGLVTSICGVVAMFVPVARPITAAMITGLVVIQIAWFVLSHRYANRHYDRPETWRATLRAMSRPAIWTELRI